MNYLVFNLLFIIEDFILKIKLEIIFVLFLYYVKLYIIISCFIIFEEYRHF